MAKVAKGLVELVSNVPGLFRHSAVGPWIRSVTHKAGQPSGHALLSLDMGGELGMMEGDMMGGVDEDSLMDYILKALRPLFVGSAIGGCVLAAYVLFVIISCCCKLCNSGKRGFCQRPQELTYKQRLPYILMVAIPAVLGLVGGAIVLSGGPGLVKAVQALIDGLVEKFDNLIVLLQSLYDNGVRAATLVDQDASEFEALNSVVTELTTFRDEGLVHFSEQMKFAFGLVTTMSSILGGGFIATALLGIIGPASLKNFLMVGFLVHTSLLTTLPFVVWGFLGVVGNIGDDICTGVDTVLAGGEGDSDLPSLPCPDVNESMESLNSIYESINEATVRINSDMLEANNGAATAFSLLQTECVAFNGTGSMYYDALCTSGSSVDAQLMTSIYQCVDSSNEGIASFNIHDAIVGTDTSCTWYATSYPSVDFGTIGSPASIEACFKTATQTINSNDGQYRGIVSAAALESGTLLTDESFVRGVLTTLPLACSFDSGTNRIQFTSSPPPALPHLCPPFDFTATLAVPTDTAVCAAAGQVPFANFGPAFGPFMCSPETVTFSDNATDNRKRCTIAGQPILPDEFSEMARNIEASTIFQKMIPTINALVDCTIIVDVIIVISTNCHPIVKAARTLGTGMLLCGIGFMIAGLLICSCWRKLNKPKGAVAPYEGMK